MPKPPSSPPSSDIDGVNRDARVGTPHKESRPDPGAQIDHAQDQSKAQPDESAPIGGEKGA